MKVFIVDDSKAVRARLIRMLVAVEGIKIIGQAQSMPEAIESIRRLRPDVVTLDIQIKGGSGIEVLQAIRRDGPFPIVAMLTNQTHPRYRKKCLESGADFFLDKSVEFEQVSTIFDGLMQRFNSLLSNE